MDTENNYEKLFRNLKIVETPVGLPAMVMVRIDNEKKRLAKIRTLAFGTISFVSFGFSLLTVFYLIESFKETGFWQYLSLIFSENEVILTYWRELSLSLVESLPIISVVIFLTTVGFFLWSLSNTFNKRDSKLIWI